MILLYYEYNMMASYCSTTTGKFVDPTEFGAAKKIRFTKDPKTNSFEDYGKFVPSNTSSLSIIRLQWPMLRSKMENRHPSTKAGVPQIVPPVLLPARRNALLLVSFVPWWWAQRWRWVPSCWWPVLRRGRRGTHPATSTVWSLSRPQQNIMPVTISGNRNI